MSNTEPHNHERQDEHKDADDNFVCNHPDHDHRHSHIKATSVKTTGKRAKDFCVHCSRHIGVAFLKELPCFLLVLVATRLSVPFLNHNRLLEAAVILIIAFGAEYGFSKFFHTREQAKLDPELRGHYHFTVKNVFAALTFAAFSWIFHDLMFHGH